MYEAFIYTKDHKKYGVDYDISHYEFITKNFNLFNITKNDIDCIQQEDLIKLLLKRGNIFVRITETSIGKLKSYISYNGNEQLLKEMLIDNFNDFKNVSIVLYDLSMNESKHDLSVKDLLREQSKEFE